MLEVMLKSNALFYANVLLFKGPIHLFFHQSLKNLDLVLQH